MVWNLHLKGRGVPADVPDLNLSGVMLNLDLQARQARVLESGVDKALLLSVPALARGAESGDETRMAVNFFLTNKVIIVS